MGFGSLARPLDDFLCLLTGFLQPLAVIGEQLIGLQALAWFALPAGIIIYLFELGLVATLQAFIFATLAAIYIGGAATHH